MIVALLDTSVLWPSTQRDFLLSLAIEGLYEARWSSVVLDELSFHEARKLASRGSTREEAERRAERLVDTMERAFPQGTVHGWQALEGSFGLPDPDDEHIAAAAVTARADVIVTANLKDFPARHLPAPLRAVSAADFAREAVRVDRGAARRALRALSSRYLSPTRTPTDLLLILRDRYGMDEVADLLVADS